jgi:hypothetical protein
MDRQELLKIQAYESYPSVSILLPTFRTAPDNRQDPIRVKNLIKQAEGRLSKEFSKRDYRALMVKIEKLKSSIDYQHALDGLALFASEDFTGVYYLPFPIKERVVIDRTFATKDLVFAYNRSPKYWVLSLSEKSTRLYSAIREHLSEVNTGGFPLIMEGISGTESLPGGYGIEKSSYLDEKRKNFIREVGKSLNKVAGFESDPLVLAGVVRLAAFFNEVYDHPETIIGTLTGNFDGVPISELAVPARELMKEYQTRRRAQLLDELGKTAAAEKRAAGIDACWKAAREGRIDKLLVEEDYAYPAMLGADGGLIPIDDPALPGAIDDAVDELIETVIAKGGNVFFMNRGRLADYRAIAAVLRY